MVYFVTLVLIAFSGIFSGLTLGFFSLNKDDLERKAELGDKKAIEVFAIRKNGNLLLVTMLFGNVSVNTALSIFLGSITPGILAGLIATFLIVIFGEIIPQAMFSRFALDFGYKLSWLVKIFIFIFYPVSRPLAFVLDKILGEEIPTVYSKKELAMLIEDHEDSKESDIDADEEMILKGALSYSEKTVEDIMTPRSAIFAMSEDEKLNKENIKKITDSGHSRIPVFREKLDNIIGTMYVKSLISLDGDWRRVNVGSMIRNEPIFVDYDKKLDDLLNAFKKTRNHMFIVLDEFSVVIGLVTIEDVIEEIIGSEIVDEFDKHENMQAMAIGKAKKRNLNKI